MRLSSFLLGFASISPNKFFNYQTSADNLLIGYDLVGLLPMDLDLQADELGNQVQLFSKLTGIIKPNPTDRFFLVMGMTGSGKSTFISRCTGKDVNVGHGLYSCKKYSRVAFYYPPTLYYLR